jgi:hypothetical protein
VIRVAEPGFHHFEPWNDMGTLTRFDISGSRCPVFIETGTGNGTSLCHVVDSADFSRAFSIEVHELTAMRAKARFEGDRKVEVIHARSTDGLREVFSRIPAGQDALIFLDAHFPGEVDPDFAGYENMTPGSESLPLAEELKLIAELRPDTKDIIVVDDLNLFEQGDYENGNIESGYANISTDDRNLDFVAGLFPGHIIERDRRDEGYLIIRPRDSAFALRELSSWYRMKRSLKRHLSKLRRRQS